MDTLDTSLKIMTFYFGSAKEGSSKPKEANEDTSEKIISQPETHKPCQAYRNAMYQTTIPVPPKLADHYPDNKHDACEYQQGGVHAHSYTERRCGNER